MQRAAIAAVAVCAGVMLPQVAAADRSATIIGRLPNGEGVRLDLHQEEDYQGPLLLDGSVEWDNPCGDDPYGYASTGFGGLTRSRGFLTASQLELHLGSVEVSATIADGGVAGTITASGCAEGVPWQSTFVGEMVNVNQGGTPRIVFGAPTYTLYAGGSTLITIERSGAWRSVPDPIASVGVGDGFNVQAMKDLAWHGTWDCSGCLPRRFLEIGAATIRVEARPDAVSATYQLRLYSGSTVTLSTADLVVVGGPPRPVPRAPNELAVAAVGDSFVDLQWNDRSSSESAFSIEERREGGFAEVLRVVAPGLASAHLAGLEPDTRHELRVRALSLESGPSAASVAVAVTTANGSPSDLTAVSIRSLPALTTRNVLSWVDNSSAEVGFEVERSSPAGAFELIGRASRDGTSWNDYPPIGPYTYRVRALYADGSASPFSDLASASIRPPSTPCATTDSELCLLDGRFRVSVAWRDAASGRSGSATGISQSDQTGLYWFFDDSNIELIAKMVDGTALNDFYWFFYGGLSTVEYWITVEDTLLDRSVTYHSPRGQLCGQLDTSSFGEEGGSAALASTEVTAVPVAVRRVARVGETGSCVPDESSLCFLDGRFRVEVDWHRGETDGVGRPVPLTGGRSGMFWFFSPSNIELIVKLIDGSAVNGKLWFFFGALSNVEYEIKVTDTSTGIQRVYHNPQGGICGQADTGAFDP